MQLRCRDQIVDLNRPAVMGVLNVTPDSFSDGGRWFEPNEAVLHAKEMVQQGAAIIDVGGESTRPGAEPVPEDEELRRVIPVIEAITDLGVPISIDTRKAAVARAGVEAGASIVNDTLGEETDGALDQVAVDSGVAICVMHSRGTPATMRELNQYEDVVDEVRAFLAARAHVLRSIGVPADSIVLDPGFGFAKNPAQNLEMLRRFAEFTDLGYPILAGTSRKSFIGRVLDLPENERVEGTIATVIWAVRDGASIVRVHDVEQVARALKVADAIERGTG